MAAKDRAAKDRKNARGGEIIIRKEEIVEGGHHGGAWKVAYADFVTAMMAFFLLMWLLNATTEEQRRGLADYFAPMQRDGTQHRRAAARRSAGKPHTSRARWCPTSARRRCCPANPPPRPPMPPMMRPPVPTRTPIRPQHPTTSRAAPASRRRRPATRAPRSTPTVRTRRAAASRPGRRRRRATPSSWPMPAPAPSRRRTCMPIDTASLRAELAQRERAAFAAGGRSRSATPSPPIRRWPRLAHQLAIDMTPEGLRIQLIDEDRRPMFASGSAEPNERARLLLAKIAPVLAKLPQPIAIAGHTDAAPYHGQRPDQLGTVHRARQGDAAAADRRRTARRRGSATSPATPTAIRCCRREPLAAANRRIAILVLRARRRAAAGAARPHDASHADDRRLGLPARLRVRQLSAVRAAAWGR